MTSYGVTKYRQHDLGNGLSPARRQAPIWSNTDLLSFGHLIKKSVKSETKYYHLCQESAFKVTTATSQPSLGALCVNVTFWKSFDLYDQIWLAFVRYSTMLYTKGHFEVHRL